MTEVHNGLSTQGTQHWSYASGTSSIPLLGLTIGDQFDQTVSRYPDNLALISRHQNIRWSYQQLQTQVNQCAKSLLHLGLQKGKRVGIWAPNCAEWCIAQFATCKIGVILVNINPSYRMHELEYVLKQSGCSVLITAAQFKSSNYTEMLYDLAPELRNCEPDSFQSALLPELTTVVRLAEDKVPGMFTWNELMTIGNDVSDEVLASCQREQQIDDEINIQYRAALPDSPKARPSVTITSSIMAISSHNCKT